jgi:hypothetical protein
VIRSQVLSAPQPTKARDHGANFRFGAGFSLQSLASLRTWQLCGSRLPKLRVGLKAQNLRVRSSGAVGDSYQT